MECHSLHASPVGLSTSVVSNRCQDELPDVTKEKRAARDFHLDLQSNKIRKRDRDSTTNEAVPSLQDVDSRDHSSPSVEMESKDADTSQDVMQSTTIETPSNSNTFAPNDCSDHDVGSTLRDWAHGSHAYDEPPLTTPQSLDSSLAFSNDESWPFVKMPFLDNDASTRNPPTQDQEVSIRNKSQCIISQPMIASPAPTSFRLSQSLSGTVLRSQLCDSTPLGQNSFHPNIFSANSELTDTDLSNFAGTPFHSRPTKVPMNQSSKLPISNNDRNRFKTATNKNLRHSHNDEQVVPVVSNNESRESKPVMAFLQGEYLQMKPRQAKMIKADPPTDVDDDEDSENKDENEEIMCTCPKTKCLKLYCVCFQRGLLCDRDVCKCTNCKNTKKESGPKGARTKAVQLIMRRRPDAFGARVKVAGLGCSCKRNRCLKKYCNCYSEGDLCSEKCCCHNCHNCEL